MLRPPCELLLQPLVVAELVKSHAVKMRSVETALANFARNLDGLLAIEMEAWRIYAVFLVSIFPKPSSFGWGWSRAGWHLESWHLESWHLESCHSCRASETGWHLQSF